MTQVVPCRERDARLLSLDYLAELGDDLVMAGAALSAGASANNVGVVELALRSARAVVVDAIGEFKSLPGEEEGAL